MSAYAIFDVDIHDPAVGMDHLEPGREPVGLNRESIREQKLVDRKHLLKRDKQVEIAVLARLVPDESINAPTARNPVLNRRRCQ